MHLALLWSHVASLWWGEVRRCSHAVGFMGDHPCLQVSSHKISTHKAVTHKAVTTWPCCCFSLRRRHTLAGFFGVVAAHNNTIHHAESGRRVCVTHPHTHITCARNAGHALSSLSVLPWLCTVFLWQPTHQKCTGHWGDGCTWPPPLSCEGYCVACLLQLLHVFCCGQQEIAHQQCLGSASCHLCHPHCCCYGLGLRGSCTCVCAYIHTGTGVCVQHAACSKPLSLSMLLIWCVCVGACRILVSFQTQQLSTACFGVSSPTGPARAHLPTHPHRGGDVLLLFPTLNGPAWGYNNTTPTTGQACASQHACMYVRRSHSGH